MNRSSVSTITPSTLRAPDLTTAGVGTLGIQDEDPLPRRENSHFVSEVACTRRGEHAGVAWGTRPAFLWVMLSISNAGRRRRLVRRGKDLPGLRPLIAALAAIAILGTVDAVAWVQPPPEPKLLCDRAYHPGNFTSVRPAIAVYADDLARILGGTDASPNIPDTPTFGHVNWTTWTARQATGERHAVDQLPFPSRAGYTPTPATVRAFAVAHGRHTRLAITYTYQGRAERELLGVHHYPDDPESGAAHTGWAPIIGTRRCGTVAVTDRQTLPA